MGGDGTLSEAVSGYMAREPSAATCTLGFVPAGTGNTYLREVLGLKAKSGLDACVRAAVAAILGGRVRAVDAAKLELTGLGENAERRISRYAINTVMAGFGPDANAAAEGCVRAESAIWQPERNKAGGLQGLGMVLCGAGGDQGWRIDGLADQ